MIPTEFDLPLSGLDWLEYYNKHNVYHPAVDFNKNSGNDDCGQDVVAPKSGFVEYVHNNTWNSGGFGKFIILIHNDGNFSRLAHLQDIDDKVIQGKEIRGGQLIGHLGNTGTTYCHLHWEVFSPNLAELQKSHWRKWRFYPSGWTKQKVREYYLNPWEWIETTSVPNWAQEAVAWVEKEEIIINVINRPVEDYRLAKILHNFYIKYIK